MGCTHSDASDVGFSARGAIAVVVCCAVECDPWRGHARLARFRERWGSVGESKG